MDERYARCSFHVTSNLSQVPQSTCLPVSSGSCRVSSPLSLSRHCPGAPPPRLLGCKIAGAIVSIAVVNYLVPALFVSTKDLWGERILPGDFHLLCAHRLTPQPSSQTPSISCPKYIYIIPPAPSDAFSSSLASFEPNTGRG